jgi:hypothetical protein
MRAVAVGLLVGLALLAILLCAVASGGRFGG